MTQNFVFLFYIASRLMINTGIATVALWRTNK